MNRTYIKLKQALSQEFMNSLKKEKKNFVPSRASKLPEGKVDVILETISKVFSFTREQALAALAALFQQGGTARGCDGNMSTEIFETTIKLADIRKILKQHSCNKSERKLARALATEIYSIALIMEIDGNLYSKIQKSNLEASYTVEERVWLSDFQSDNPDCPIRMRTLIQETFQRKSEKKKK
jgi:hypothetical protein